MKHRWRFNTCVFIYHKLNKKSGEKMNGITYEINNEVFNSLKSYQKNEKIFYYRLKDYVDQSNDMLLSLYLENVFNLSKTNSRISLIDTFLKNYRVYSNLEAEKEIVFLTSIFTENLKDEINEIGNKSSETSINILSANNALIEEELVDILKNLNDSRKSVSFSTNTKNYDIVLPQEKKLQTQNEVIYAKN